MIAYLTGRVIATFESNIVLKLPSGVGYLISVSPYKTFIVNENLDFFIWEIWREDRSELFAFESLEDRKWAEKLTKVSGVGPKSSASIVYALGYKQIQEAISVGDSTIFSSVKGLGTKTAKKIVLELKGAITDLEALTPNEATSEMVINFTDTLTNLGYKRGEIVSAISSLKKSGEWQDGNLVVLVKKGLKILGK